MFYVLGAQKLQTFFYTGVETCVGGAAMLDSIAKYSILV